MECSPRRVKTESNSRNQRLGLCITPHFNINTRVVNRRSLKEKLPSKLKGEENGKR
jgi:hypothetical protein